MRALVTGASGFLGHHLVDLLLEETDWELLALGSPRSAAPARLGPRLRFLRHDLRSPIDPRTAERIGEVEVIFNLASCSDGDRSIADPVGVVETNVAIALHALELARACRPRAFVHFSTGEVYGPAPDGVAFPEGAPHVPTSPYAASKSAQEAIVTAYWRTFGVPVVILNLLNVFGEHQRPGRFVPVCISHLAEGREVPIFGERVNGAWVSGSRPWLYARDAADAARFVAERLEPAQYPDADRPSRYHVVGEEETDLALAWRIARILGVRFRYRWVDGSSARPGWGRRYALDGSRLADAGWRPSIGLEEGLRQTVSSSRAGGGGCLSSDRGEAALCTAVGAHASISDRHPPREASPTCPP